MISSDIPDDRGKRLPSSDFPPELVEGILLKLPAEPLVRFRRVSKSWLALIEDTGFAKKHLRVRSENENISVPFLLMRKHVHLPVEPGRLFWHGISIVHMHDEGDDDNLACVVDELDLSQSLKTRLGLQSSDHLLTMSHCNGIICLSESIRKPDSKIFLCNPVLKQIKCVSQPIVHPARCTSAREGFRYDSSADDYKFVRIWKNGGRPEARLYSLGSDSWREIDTSNLKFSKLSLHPVYCRGACHWSNLASSDDPERRSIVAFDMSKEKFWSVPLPGDILVDPCLYWDRVALWKESVVFFNLIHISKASTVFEMWVMSDGKSWIKHMTIGPLTNIYRPMWIWNDEELFLETTDNCVVSYNLSTKKLRKLALVDVVLAPTVYHFELYTESLVPVKR